MIMPGRICVAGIAMERAYLLVGKYDFSKAASLERPVTEQSLAEARVHERLVPVVISRSETFVQLHP
jgi:hypothetical protein